MKQRGKKFFLAGMILIVLFILTAGLFFFTSDHIDKTVGQTVSDNTGQESLTSLPGDKVKVEDAAVVKNTPKPARNNFKTNEEIRREYGRLEVVYLFSGKRYEGAVVSIGQYYTMVTVEGVVKIPMNEVRIRDIIK